jgi:C-terminal processing protease CtpA/Prc
MFTLLLLSMLSLQDPKPEQKLTVENTKLLVFDSAREMTLRILQDGKVELTIQEEDKAAGKKAPKTVSAASVAEFRTKYPDLVKKYELNRHLGGEARKAVAQDDFEEWWKQLKKGVPDLGPVPGLDQPFDEDMQKFFDEQFGRLRRPFRFPKDPTDPSEAPRQAPLPGGRELGVRVQEVGETLRDQLSLKENEGVIVTEVKPGSTADKAGLKEHDILLKLEGKAITDRWQFRADVLSALGKPEFELQVLRSGKRETVKVKTSARKDE